MRTNYSRWKSVVLLVFAIGVAATTGCTSGIGSGWQKLAWWKKGPAPDSIASRPGPNYPTPPSTRFTPQSTSTAQSGLGGGYTSPNYSPNNTAQNPATGPTSPYPTTPYGGSTYGSPYGSTQAASPSYSSSSAPPQKGYYSVNPPATAYGSANQSYGTGSPADSYRSADLRNQAAPPSRGSAQAPAGGYSTTAPAPAPAPANPGSYDNPYGTGNTYGASNPYGGNSGQWNSGPPSTPASTINQGQSSPNSYQPSSPLGTSSGSSAPSATGGDYQGPYGLNNSTPNQGRSSSTANEQYSSGPNNTNPRGAEPPLRQLPTSLTQRLGSYGPGSIGRASSSLASAAPIGRQASEGNDHRAVQQAGFQGTTQDNSLRNSSPGGEFQPSTYSNPAGYR